MTTSDVITGSEAMWHLSPAQWWLLISNAAFWITAAMARLRRQWIRLVGFTLVVPASVLYHLSVDTSVLDPHDTYALLDRVVSVYLSVTTVMLLAHFRTQVLELIVEALSLPFVYVAADHMQDWDVGIWKYLLPPAATLVLVVIPTWVFNGWCPARVPWFLAGLACGAVATGSFLVNNSFEDPDTALSLHGLWHASAAMSITFLIYALRDPALLEGYVMMEDVL